jgi:hypothetical protein
LIFGIWRNRRQEQDDELLSAYIDRRLGGDAEVELPVHLHADAAGLAETAAILRSVERVRAPRSFALTPEMVQASASPSFSSLSKRTGLSLALFRAPAIAAAAAAFILGLLVVGNIAGILEQDGSRSFAASTLSDSAVSAPTSGGSAEAARESDAAFAPEAGTSAPAEGVAAPDSAPSEAAGAPLAPPLPDGSSDSAPSAAPLAPTGDTSLAAPPPVMEASAPEAGGGIDAPVENSAAADSADLLESGGADAVDLQERLADELEKAPESGSDGSLSLPAQSGGGLFYDDEGVLPGDGGFAEPDFAIAEAGLADVNPGNDDITLPLWQLEVVLGLLALVLGGAAFAMKRR